MWPLSGGRLHFHMNMRLCQKFARRRSVRRACARAGGELCIAQNRKVAMLPWRPKWPLSDGGLGFQVNLRFSQVSARRRSVRRARACWWVVLHCVEKKSRHVAVGVKVALNGDRLGFHVKLRCLLSDVGQAAQRSPRARAPARARAGSSVLRRLEKTRWCLGN